MVHQSNRPIIKNKKIKGGSNAESLAVLLSCSSYNDIVSRWLAKNYESANAAQERAKQLLSEKGAKEGLEKAEEKHKETVMEWKKCQIELDELEEGSKKKAKALECQQLAIKTHHTASAKRDLEIAHQKHKFVREKKEKLEEEQKKKKIEEAEESVKKKKQEEIDISNNNPSLSIYERFKKPDQISREKRKKMAKAAEKVREQEYKLYLLNEKKAQENEKKAQENEKKAQENEKKAQENEKKAKQKKKGGNIKTRYRNKRILKKRTKKKGGSGFSYGTQRKECPSFTKQFITWLVDLTVAEPLDEAEAYLPKGIELAIKVVDGIEEIMKRFKTDSEGIPGINDQTKPEGPVAKGNSRQEATANQLGQLAAAVADTSSTAAGSTPAGATPAGATPAGSTPAGATPAGSTPAGHAPTGSSAAADSSAPSAKNPAAPASAKNPAVPAHAHAPAKKPAPAKKSAPASSKKHGGNKKRKTKKRRRKKSTKKNRRKILIRSRKR